MDLTRTLFAMNTDVIQEKKLIRKRAIDKNMKISEYIMDLVEKDIKNLEEKKC